MATVTNLKQKIKKLKAERGALRTAFTRALPPPETPVTRESFCIFEDKAQRLFDKDEDILALLEDEQAIQVEMEQADVYRTQFFRVKARIDASPPPSVIASNQSASGSGYRLPKLTLQAYDLAPKTWLGFWGQYQRIHDDEELHVEDKFQYLLLCLKKGTRARSLIEGYPPVAENYQKAIAQLKARYGREDILIEYYTRELLQLVSEKCNNLPLLSDKLNSKLSSLASLGVKSDKYAAMLLPLVESCLPVETLKLWERARGGELRKRVEGEREGADPEGPLAPPDPLADLMAFLEVEVQGEERIALARTSLNPGTTEEKSKMKFQSANPETVTSAALHVNGSRTYLCIFCDVAEHKSEDCPKARTWPLEERVARVTEKRVCFSCLRGGHRSRFCRVNVKCKSCGGHHLVLLCRGGGSKKETSEPSLHTGGGEQVIHYKTIMVKVCSQGKERAVRALIDDGSARSFIVTQLAEEMGLVPVAHECTDTALFGGLHMGPVQRGIYRVTVKSMAGDFTGEMEMRSERKICDSVPRVRDPELVRTLQTRGITLTDIGRSAAPIEILLGAQHIGSLLTGRIEVLPCGISAIQSKLGWSIVGTRAGKTASNPVVLCMLTQEQVPRMWALETLGIEGQGSKPSGEEIQKHFEGTVAINEEGRYQVQLPWKVGHPPLDNHRDMAESRLRSVTRRLIKDNKFEAYDAVLQGWVVEGIVEEVVQEVSACHYLPHRPVYRESSSSTKIRPIFDASVKRKGGVSLNECLEIGPNLIQEIPAVLARFRVNAIGVAADVKQAFLQISLAQDDRDVLRFLWWKEGRLQEYRHCRVVFGVAPSPFLLNATIKHHLQAEEFRTPDLKDTQSVLAESFYCDDLVTSVRSEEDLGRLVKQATAIMATGKFQLHKWVSNGPIPDAGHEVVQSILGVKWDTGRDVLFCTKPVVEGLEAPITKRGLLSLVNQIFDPVGFLSPATLLPKLLLQDAWREKIDWDVELPLQLQQRYLRWARHLDALEDCNIPRRLHRGENMEDCCSLHMFSDSSGYAAACCVYIRCTHAGEVSLSLVAAKARVGPMDKMTIPRMELLAALLGVRLVKTVLKGLGKELPCYFWSDSTVALAWITNSQPWKTWVGNRVAEIREGSAAEAWRHVDGDLNPADLPSRGCDFKALKEKRWLEGPVWLLEEESSWPGQACQGCCPDEALKERRKGTMTVVAVENEPFSERLKYFSSYPRILRMIAWIMRFRWNAGRCGVRREGVLSSEELASAELVLFRVIQAEWPMMERKKCETNVQMYEDETGLVHLKTRLLLGEEPEVYKRPVVLPDHPIVRKMILSVHLRGHTGVQTTLNSIREHVWILRGRRLVRQVLNECLRCKRFKVKSVQPEEAPLPTSRTMLGAAFQSTGVDLAGPLFLKRDGKAWIVLYTCAVYRAVHLELVSAISTEAFLMSLRRFIARRGRPQLLHCDRGSNFVGAANLLRDLDWGKIENETAPLKIQWRFSCPAAPWQGGFWERLIGVVKDLLRKTLGRAFLNYEEMVTVLCACESDVNARPITYHYDDEGELRPLTPAHFLTDLQGSTVDLDEVDREAITKRVRYRQELRDRLKDRFHEEYIRCLVGRPREISKSQIKEGEIVLVGSENLKRTFWPLGKVVEVLPGKDGVHRVAKVQLAQGMLLRPFQKLFPLEVPLASLEPKQVYDSNPKLSIENENCNDKTEPPAEEVGGTLSDDSSISPERVLPMKTAHGRIVRAPKKLDL